MVDNSELADLAGMMRLMTLHHAVSCSFNNSLYRDNKLVPPKQTSKLQEQLQSRLEDRKNKSKKSMVGSSKQAAKLKSR